MNIFDLWIPIELKEPDENNFYEILEEFNHNEKCVFACNIPEDGEQVLVSDINGLVHMTYFCKGPNSGYFNGFISDEITAWMPLPPAYKKDDHK